MALRPVVGRKPIPEQGWLCPLGGASGRGKFWGFVFVGGRPEYPACSSVGSGGEGLWSPLFSFLDKL